MSPNRQLGSIGPLAMASLLVGHERRSIAGMASTVFMSLAQGG